MSSNSAPTSSADNGKERKEDSNKSTSSESNVQKASIPYWRPNEPGQDETPESGAKLFEERYKTMGLDTKTKDKAEAKSTEEQVNDNQNKGKEDMDKK